MKKHWLLLLFIIWGCGESKQPVNIELNPNGTLKLTGLDIAVMNDIDRDTAKNKWQKLLPVYHMPVQDDLMDDDAPLPGTYKLSGDHVLFTPATPFIKGQKYFARFYLFNEGTSMWDIISKKKRPGQQKYRDILFDPQYLKNK